MRHIFIVLTAIPLALAIFSSGFVVYTSQALAMERSITTEKTCLKLVKRHGRHSAKMNNKPRITHRDWVLRKVKTSGFFDSTDWVKYIYSIQSGGHRHAVFCQIDEHGSIFLEVDVDGYGWAPLCDNIGANNQC